MITLSLLALLYFLPTILAAKQGHDVAPILLLNLFFGWTVIGWFAMLLWALLSTPRYYAVGPPPTYYPYAGWRR
jgi:Superinfection immunity protein